MDFDDDQSKAFRAITAELEQAAVSYEYANDCPMSELFTASIAVSLARIADSLHHIAEAQVNR